MKNHLLNLIRIDGKLTEPEISTDLNLSATDASVQSRHNSPGSEVAYPPKTH
jgi:hypothetical protein